MPWFLESDTIFVYNRDQMLYFNRFWRNTRFLCSLELPSFERLEEVYKASLASLRNVGSLLSWHSFLCFSRVKRECTFILRLQGWSLSQLWFHSFSWKELLGRRKQHLLGFLQWPFNFTRSCFSKKKKKN